MLLISLAILAVGLGRTFLATSTNSVLFVPEFLNGFFVLLVLVQTLLFYAYFLNRFTEGKSNTLYRDVPTILLLVFATLRVYVDRAASLDHPAVLFIATQTMGCFYAAVLFGASVLIHRVTEEKEVTGDLRGRAFREA